MTGGRKVNPGRDDDLLCQIAAETYILGCYSATTSPDIAESVWEDIRWPGQFRDAVAAVAAYVENRLAVGPAASDELQAIGDRLHAEIRQLTGGERDSHDGAPEAYAAVAAEATGETVEALQRARAFQDSTISTLSRGLVEVTEQFCAMARNVTRTRWEDGRG